MHAEVYFPGSTIGNFRSSRTPKPRPMVVKTTFCNPLLCQFSNLPNSLFWTVHCTSGTERLRFTPVEEDQTVNKGEGGFAEDHEYFGELANL